MQRNAATLIAVIIGLLVAPAAAGAAIVHVETEEPAPPGMEIPLVGVGDFISGNGGYENCEIESVFEAGENESVIVKELAAVPHSCEAKRLWYPCDLYQMSGYSSRPYTGSGIAGPYDFDGESDPSCGGFGFFQNIDVNCKSGVSLTGNFNKLDLFGDCVFYAPSGATELWEATVQGSLHALTDEWELQ